MDNIHTVKYPKIVLIESTNYCNLKCRMCPQGNGLIKKQGFMNFNLYKKIIDDITSIKEYKPVVGLHMTGEPLLHNQFIDMVNYASKSNLYTFIHTNGVLLNRELGENLIKANISEITFSFEGENKEIYENLRCNSDYELVKKNIKDFLKLNNKTKVIIEVLKFRKKDSTLEISDAFKKEFEGAEFRSYYASDWHGDLQNDELSETCIYSQKPSMCPNAQKVFAISWDGMVHPCGLDYNSQLTIGDMNKENIMDIWNGEERKKILSIMGSFEYSKLSLCKNCSAPYTAKTKEHLNNE